MSVKTFRQVVGGQSLDVTYQDAIESATAIKGTLDLAGMGGGTFTAKQK